MNLLKKATETKYKEEGFMNRFRIHKQENTIHAPHLPVPLFVPLKHCEVCVCHLSAVHTHQRSVSEVDLQMELDRSRPSNIRFSPTSSTQLPGSFIMDTCMKTPGKRHPA